MNEKRTLRWLLAALAVGALAALLYNHKDLFFKPEGLKVELRSHNTLYADGKPALFFRGIGADSALLGIDTIASSVAFAEPVSLSGGELRAVVSRNCRLLDARLRWLQGAMDEMEYYLRVHGVQDEGYEMVAAHEADIERDISETRRWRRILGAAASAERLEARHVADSGTVAEIRLKPIFVEYGGGIWANGLWAKTARKGKGLTLDPAGRVILGTWAADTLAHGTRKDSLGTYRGQFSPHGFASGHGSFTAADGSFYEGHWQRDRRQGFGFMVNNTRLSAGEWSKDRYRGERMNYTSDRIYGIDISRYQHGHGRKYFPIEWGRLRITGLGRANRGAGAAAADYPVSFVYIKSTEGTTVRNRHFAADYRQARRHGILCGAYHFFSTRTSGKEQAAYFLKHTAIRAGDLPPVLDVEPTDAQIAQMGGPEKMFAEMRVWLEKVMQKTGVRPVIYINQRFVNVWLPKAPDIKRDYNVWIARYGAYRPDVRLLFWQLCADGKVDGIRGHVDINVFNGFREQYDEFRANHLVE